MKLKEILNEMLADKDVVYKNVFGRRAKFDIFENPTPEQLRETGEMRAIKTINGKIYTVSDQDTNGIIHEDLVKIFSENGYITSQYNNNWWKEPDSVNHFVCIIMHKGKWFLSESYIKMKLVRKIVSDKYTGIKPMTKVEYDEQ